MRIALLVRFNHKSEKETGNTGKEHAGPKDKVRTSQENNLMAGSFLFRLCLSSICQYCSFKKYLFVHLSLYVKEMKYRTDLNIHQWGRPIDSLNLAFKYYF